MDDMAAVLGQGSPEVRVVGERGLLRLCSWRREHAESSIASEAFGRVLPSGVGTATSEFAHLLCVAPGEWLLVGGIDNMRAIHELLEPSVRLAGLVLTDLSHAFVAVQVRGARSRDLLAKGCGLDFNQRRFPPGHCARTLFARALVVVDCLDDSPTFELHVARSYAPYLIDWLHDAAVEFARARH